MELYTFDLLLDSESASEYYQGGIVIIHYSTYFDHFAILVSPRFVVEWFLRLLNIFERDRVFELIYKNKF